MHPSLTPSEGGTQGAYTERSWWETWVQSLFGKKSDASVKGAQSDEFVSWWDVIVGKLKSK